MSVYIFVHSYVYVYLNIGLLIRFLNTIANMTIELVIVRGRKFDKGVGVYLF